MSRVHFDHRGGIAARDLTSPCRYSNVDAFAMRFILEVFGAVEVALEEFANIITSGSMDFSPACRDEGFARSLADPGGVAFEVRADFLCVHLQKRSDCVIVRDLIVQSKEFGSQLQSRMRPPVLGAAGANGSDVV